MSDYDNSDDEEDIIARIKEDYTLDEFLVNDVTGPILQENAIQRYECRVESFLGDFYRNEVDYATYSGATIFNNEKDYDHLDDLFKIVFANVNLNYNLDTIYNDEHLIKEFAYSVLKPKPENS